MNEILQRLCRIGIVPVLSVEDAEKALGLANALSAGGLPAAGGHLPHPGGGGVYPPDRRELPAGFGGGGHNSERGAVPAGAGRRRPVHCLPRV